MSTKWTYHLLFQNSSFLLSFQKPLQVDVNTSDKKGQHKKTFEIENRERNVFLFSTNKQTKLITNKATNKQSNKQTKQQTNKATNKKETNKQTNKVDNKQTKEQS
jgi:hypothetical protein